tara:strand:+ start:106 stop:666 length:561 start_codon:yes stop_codon:yes gene_type:complete
MVEDDKKLIHSKINIDKEVSLWIGKKEYYGKDLCPERDEGKKILSNRIAKIIDWSINKGNHHFGITINNIAESRLEYDNVNYNIQVVKRMYSKIANILHRHFPTITFFQIVVERNKKGYIHYHILVSIRLFIDYNVNVKNNLTLILNEELNSELEDPELTDVYGTKFDYNFDIKVSSLRYFKDIKN